MELTFMFECDMQQIDQQDIDKYEGLVRESWSK